MVHTDERVALLFLFINDVFGVQDVLDVKNGSPGNVSNTLELDTIRGERFFVLLSFSV